MPRKSKPRTQTGIWSSEWIANGESIASILLKASFVNALNVHELARTVGFGNVMQNDGLDFMGNVIDESKLSQWLGLSADDIESLKLSDLMGLIGWSPIHVKTFKYCPECLSGGYHSKYFQIAALEKCPVHDVPLYKTCRHCGEAAPRYGFCRELFEAPYHCNKCGALLANRPVTISSLFKKADSRHTCWMPMEAWIDSLRRLKLGFVFLRDWIAADCGMMVGHRQIDAMHIVGLLSPLPQEYSWIPAICRYGAFRFVGENRILKNMFFKSGTVADTYEKTRQAIERRLLTHSTGQIVQRCKRYGWQIMVRPKNDGLSFAECAYVLWRCLFENVAAPEVLMERKRDSGVHVPGAAFPCDWRSINDRQWKILMRATFASLWIELNLQQKHNHAVVNASRYSPLRHCCIIPDLGSLTESRGIFVYPELKSP